MDITINGVSVIQLIGFLAVLVPIAFGPLLYLLKHPDIVDDNIDDFIFFAALWAVIAAAVGIEIWKRL